MQQDYHSIHTPGQSRQMRTRLKLIIGVLLLLILAVGLGTYFWQQARVDQLSRDNESLNEQVKAHQPDVEKQASTPATKLATFNVAPAPFTFTYRADFSVAIDKPLQADLPLDDQYSIELSAPGTIGAEQPIGGSFVKKGARIVVWDTKTSLTNIQDRFTGVYTSAKNRSNTTVAELPAVEYEFAYESDPGIFTDFIKDGRLYSIGFFAEGDEKTSPAFADYKALLASFRFE